ncbi:MAG: quinone-dependent dihydroorotate dehydrogenase [Minisyncoccia bacterium]
MDKLVGLRNYLAQKTYRWLIKPVFFLFAPETIHDIMAIFLRFLGKSSLTRAIAYVSWGYSNKALAQDILGIHFKNPIGLSAGFDKNAQMINIMPSLGFGFTEVGSITGMPCAGNPKPRLWRLKKSKSLAVYYGLKNDGCEAVSKRLSGKKFPLPVGISIAKTNSPETIADDKAIADYFNAYMAFQNIGSYVTINISCPNAFGGQPFTDSAKLDSLLAKIMSVPKTKPIFIKISPDLNLEEIDRIVEVVYKYNIDGYICSNLTKNRDNIKIIDKNIPEKGGLSGKVVEGLSDNLIAYIYKKTGGKYVIIGVGGVFTAEDAYKKIKSGASLIQMITGMIFQGPQTVSSINLGLVGFLRKDGYKNISEAVGKH